MKKVWQIILLALLGLALAVSFALLISHAVVSVLDREEARELELEREAFRQRAEQVENVLDYAETYGGYYRDGVVLSRLTKIWKEENA